MHTLRIRLVAATDRLACALVVALLLGSALAFGGATWWARPAIGALTLLLATAGMLRALLAGRWHIIRSPMVPLGALALLLAAVQLAPLPPSAAAKLSPRARDWHARGTLPALVRADDPSAELPEPVGGRSAAAVDRPATLRWLLGATACLALFAAVAQATDRLGRLRLVWGSIIAAFLLNTAVALVQLAGGSGGLYGFIEPGQGPAWAPSWDDLLATPNATALRPAGESGWALPRPDRPFLVGSLMGGPGAYLALGALALPLALSMSLHLLAPRGSREGLRDRLRQSGQGGLFALFTAGTVAGSLLVGLMAGPWLALPFALGLVAAGLPGARASGLGRAAVAITGLALLGLGAGVAIGERAGRPSGAGPLATAADRATALRTWSEATRIARDFPIVGAGLGGFASVHPFYKGTDAGTTTARSSLLQWWAESGAVGLVILALGVGWGLVRLPRAIRGVGSADRPLAFGLVGAVACFALVSALHWTVELPAIALAAAAVGGTCDRWLAGGTDLFVEGD